MFHVLDSPDTEPKLKCPLKAESSCLKAISTHSRQEFHLSSKKMPDLHLNLILATNGRKLQHVPFSHSKTDSVTDKH